MIKGKTKSGFKFEIDPEVFDDMELLDALASSMAEDPLQISKVVGKILGDKKKDLYDHVRAESGRVPVEAIGDEIREMMEAAAAGKK